jgi:hypothetical protein
MLLCIDVGNTNVTFGLFNGEELGPCWRIRTIHDRMPDEYGILMDQLFRHRGQRPEEVSGVVIASVVPPLTPIFEQVCRDYIGQKPLVMGVGVRSGVRIRYDNPWEVGADRVADAAAVRALYNLPACVVDFGTATTFDAISADGDYLGGAIAPGIGIAAKGGADPSAVGYRAHDHPQHPVRLAVRLRGAGRGNGRPLPSGAGGKHDRHRYRRPDRNHRPRNRRDPDSGPLADPQGAAHCVGA